MLQKVIVQESTFREHGTGQRIELGVATGKLLVLTLVISHTVPQQGLSLSIWGSPDGLDWGTHPLLMIPQKYYCGIYSLLLNLAKHPQARYLRAEWKMNRWSKGDSAPVFSFFVYSEESGARVRSAVA